MFFVKCAMNKETVKMLDKIPFYELETYLKRRKEATTQFYRR